MIALVFLYFTSLIFVYGGEFNYAIKNLSKAMRAPRVHRKIARSRDDSPVGSPLGFRGRRCSIAFNRGRADAMSLEIISSGF